MAKVWFVTGCSSGFGRVLCQELIAAGDQVVATARNVEKVRDLERAHPDHVLALPLDVTDAQQVGETVAQGLARFGRLDVVVNNAGYGLIGGVEEVGDDEIRALFDVNVFGVLNVLRAALPSMRAARSGHILNISSTAGMLTLPGSSAYAASKHALEALTEGLRMELAPLGIRVICVEPGPFRTDFAGRSIVIAKHQIGDYDETAGRRRTGIKEFDGTQCGDPVLGVRAMMRVVEEAEPPGRLALGGPAYDQIRKQLDSVRAELDQWEWLGKPTDYSP